MVGLTQAIRRTFGWALRLMFGRIELQTIPPQTAVPMRSVVSGEVATHAPVEITVHAKRVNARSAAGKGVALPVVEAGRVPD